LSLNSCHLSGWKMATLLTLQQLLPTIYINLLLIKDDINIARMEMQRAKYIYYD
jgi:hypothetical protein